MVESGCWWAKALWVRNHALLVYGPLPYPLYFLSHQVILLGAHHTSLHPPEAFQGVDRARFREMGLEALGSIGRAWEVCDSFEGASKQAALMAIPPL